MMKEKFMFRINPVVKMTLEEHDIIDRIDGGLSGVMRAAVAGMAQMNDLEFAAFISTGLKAETDIVFEESKWMTRDEVEDLAREDVRKSKEK